MAGQHPTGCHQVPAQVSLVVALQRRRGVKVSRPAMCTTSSFCTLLLLSLPQLLPCHSAPACDARLLDLHGCLGPAGGLMASTNPRSEPLLPSLPQLLPCHSAPACDACLLDLHGCLSPAGGLMASTNPRKCRKLQAILLDHGWKEVHMHACVIGHTRLQPQSNMAVLQTLQVDDANGLLAAVHMHSVNTCYSLLGSYEKELKRIQAAAGLEAAPEGQPPPRTQQNLQRSSQAIGPRPKRNKHHKHPHPPQDIQTNTQEIMWPQQPMLAAYSLMEASSAPRHSIRLKWHPG